MNESILIVDDERSTRIAIGHWARGRGYTALEAESAERALDILKRTPADLAIVDLKLPGTDGLALAKLLLAQDPDRPVLLITAYADLSSAQRALRLGVYEYLTKPFDLETLGAGVERALERRRLVLENRMYQRELECQVEECAARLKAANEQLREKLEKYERAMEENARLAAFPNENPNPILACNFDGEVTYANPVTQHLLKRLGGKQITGILPESHLQLVRAGLEKGSGVLEAEATVGDRVFLWNYCPVPAIGIVYLYGMDITERRRDREALNKLSSAVEQTADAVVITDRDGTIEYVNPAFEKITGYTKEEAIGQNPRILKSGRQSAAFYRRLWKTIRSGRVFREMFVNRRKDGELFDVEHTITPMKDGGGNITHFVAVWRDISERKRLEEQLLHAQKMEAVGRLAGGVAHDFNNLLTVINGYSKLLLRCAGGETLRSGLGEIQKAGERAASLTRQLLAFSRRQVLQPKVLDLNGVVSDMDKMLRRLIGADIEMVTILRSSRTYVKADPGQLEQVILNLAVNARDAMPEGGRLAIETADGAVDAAFARRYEGVQPGDYVVLCVSDTGVGMDAETRERIFEPFFTTKEQGKGTGLGLSTVYGIVAQSGGCIDVESEAGAGTTFKVYLPRVEKGEDAREAGGSSGASHRGFETVLLVEDEEMVRDFARQALAEYGYTVLDASDGEDAFQICMDHDGPVHLLLTDVVMPQMSGEELAGRLAPLYPGMKVLYMSGYTDDAVVQHGVLEAGVAFIQKPFTPEELARKVREALDRAG